MSSANCLRKTHNEGITKWCRDASPISPSLRTLRGPQIPRMYEKTRGRNGPVYMPRLGGKGDSLRHTERERPKIVGAPPKTFRVPDYPPRSLVMLPFRRCTRRHPVHPTARLSIRLIILIIPHEISKKSRIRFSSKFEVTFTSAPLSSLFSYNAKWRVPRSFFLAKTNVTCTNWVPNFSVLIAFLSYFPFSQSQF